MDSTSYDKRKKYKPGHGFEPRDGVLSSIVVHSTSNPHQKNTPFEKEAEFLFDAPLVSAHYLIGKDGRVVQFLDPRAWAAWHAGRAVREYQNDHSIGIELHHSVGDPPYPQAQMDALAVLLRSLMAEFHIPAERIETHGQIAIPGPYDRKTDPSDMSYQAFLRFRSALVSGTPPAPVYPHYVLVVPCAPLQARNPSAPLAAGVVFAAGDVVNVGNTQDGWHWVSDRVDTPPGIGFIPVSYARKV